MRTRAIVNPRSARGRTGRQWPALQKRLETTIGEVDAVFTEAPMAAVELTRQALRDGVDQIIAVGGDGTVNEVVNGFFADGESINPDAVLAIMMLGTGGDFRKTLKLGPDVDDYFRCLADGEVRSIDLGALSYHDHEGNRATRYFNNIASFGLSGAVDNAVNRAGFSKLLGGTFAFYWATLSSIIRHDNPPVRIQIDDAYDEVIRVSTVAVCNGQYFGGGMWVAPHARPDDGQFDVVLMHDLSTMDFLRSSGDLYKGKHIDNPKVDVVRGRRVVATPQQEGDAVLLDVDGEAPGRLPAQFEVLPRALRVRY